MVFFSFLSSPFCTFMFSASLHVLILLCHLFTSGFFYVGAIQIELMMIMMMIFLANVYHFKFACQALQHYVSIFKKKCDNM